MRVRLRLPIRLSLALLLAGLALPLLAATVEAAPAVSLTVHAGYQDVVKLGQWVPVTIDVHNGGTPIEGTLEVQQSLTAQPGVTGFTVYQQPISLVSGATKRVRTFIEIDATGATVTARILEKGRVIASQDAQPRGTATTLIGVLSDQLTTLDDFGAVHPASIAARVVHLRGDELPESAIALRAFDILAIDDFATDGLTAAQRTAVTDFVNQGGSLLLGTGAAWHKTLAGLSNTLLPLHVTGTVVVDATAPGAGAVELATGTLGSGQSWLDENGRPLLVEGTVGGGTVTMATFDWNQQPVAVAADERAILRQVMSRAVFGSGSGGQNVSYSYVQGGGAMIASPNFASQPSAPNKSGAYVSVLGDLPELALPSLQLTGALVLVYVLIVGPVNYFILGALHRRALAWITIPMISIIATAGAYGAGVATKGRSVQLNQVAVLHLQSGWDHAYQETYTGVIPPSRGDYQLTIGGGSHPLIGPIANSYNYSPNLGNGAAIRVDLPTNGITLSRMTAFSLGGFASESMTKAPGLTAQLQLVNGRLTGTVENRSSLTFTDAVLIAGDSFQLLPELKPGATAHVSLIPKPSNPFGTPLYTRIYPGQYVNPGIAADSAGRQSSAKTQVLSTLPLGGSFKGYVLNASPLLVAWTHEPFQTVRVNGDQPRSSALSAVALSLPVDQIGTGLLPAGIVSGRIVDVVGDGQANGTFGMLILQRGSVTFEFLPALSSGTHLSGASVTSTNPNSPRIVVPGGASPGSAAGTPGLRGEVWDWANQGWVEIGYQDNGSTALPESAVNPSTGAVRLRITSSNESYIPTAITLSGTVR